MPNRYWKMFQAGFSEQEQNKQKQMHKYKEKTDDCHRGGGWGDGQKGMKGEWEIQAFGYRMNKSWRWRISVENVMGNTVVVYSDRW